ncbi:MAG TPA: DUF4405 domain-containing protein [Tepidisphaeraceae bacterium]|nr:DUF4405 domain-containing protein [Tepidisphaeraceae bacterium]
MEKTTKSQVRVLVSPATAMTFLAVGVTGVMMLLHVRSGPLKELHELSGLVMVVLGAVHLILNWRAFLGYFKRWQASVSAALVVIIALVILLAAGNEQHRGRPGDAQHREQGAGPVEPERAAL